MKDKLIQSGFNEWLMSLELAPYPFIFWDMPMFVQMSYIQKWLREIHNVNNLNIYPIYHNDILFGYGYWRGILGMSNLYLFNKQPLFPTYEEALETGLQEALKLIK